VGNDDAWDRGSVIRPNEYGRWASGISTIINRHTQETDADRLMRMMARIKEADVGATERAVGKQKLVIVGGAGHRSVVGVSKRKSAFAIIRFSQATKQDGIWSVIDVDGLGGWESRDHIGNWDCDGVGAGYVEACFEVDLLGGGDTEGVLLETN
jgi:hypothetical protein